MTLLRFGETVLNFDQIAFIVPENAPASDPGMGVSVPVTLGYTVHFSGGGKVYLKDPQFMAAFEAWTATHGFKIELLWPPAP